MIRFEHLIKTTFEAKKSDYRQDRIRLINRLVIDFYIHEL